MSIVFWSTFFMLLTSILCTIGLLSRTFKDNLWQTLGMWAGMIGCGSRVPDIWARTDIPFDWFLVHACLGLFAIGTAWKVIKIAHAAKLARFAEMLRLNSEGWGQPTRSSFHRRKGDY